MNKEIYFCVDKEAWYSINNHIVKSKEDWKHCICAENYTITDNAIKGEWKYIVTYSIAHLSFDLITLGYDIYLCYGDKRVKIEPHMDLSGVGEPCKDLRFGHNIFKMFRAGIFNELLGIKEGGSNEQD